MRLSPACPRCPFSPSSFELLEVSPGFIRKERGVLKGTFKVLIGLFGKLALVSEVHIHGLTDDRAAALV